MKRTGLAAKGSKSSGSSTKHTASKLPVAAALCLKNEGCDDLELRKLYRILPDKKGAAEGFLRVVDESGEDYLYPADYFAIIRVSATVAKSLLLVA